MPIRVICDACVLYPAHLRDLIIRVAQAGLVQAGWTEEILDETFRSIRVNLPSLDPARLARTRELMNAAIPDVVIEDYEHLMDELDLPDPHDRHVLAAAIVFGASAIVTFNLRDFPHAVVSRYSIEARHPDDVFQEVIEQAPTEMQDLLYAMHRALQDPHPTLQELLAWLRRSGLTISAEQLRMLVSQ